MIRISKRQRYELDKLGLLKYKKNGNNPQDQNFIVANKTHRSRHKTYYVVEEPYILLYLQKYDGLNLQKINQEQFDKLKREGLLPKNKIQLPGEHKPYALAFVDNKGEYRIKKATKLMVTLGFWKPNNNYKNSENN